MTIRFSTGLRNAMLGSTGASAALNDGIIYIYSGAQPASADNAVSGTLLLKITVDAGAWTAGAPTNGLGFEAAAAGVLSKAAAETWKGLGEAAGTAGWARFCGNTADAGGASTTLARIDMAVAKTGADLNISNTVIAVGAPTTIDTFNLTMNES